MLQENIKVLMFYSRLLDFGFAEQYGIQTGQRHLRNTTSVNIDGGYDKKGNKKLLDMKTTRQN
jgi:hypothetical protein